LLSRTRFREHAFENSLSRTRFRASLWRLALASGTFFKYLNFHLTRRGPARGIGYIILMPNGQFLGKMTHCAKQRFYRWMPEKNVFERCFF
jgi:hypothetical protein